MRISTTRNRQAVGHGLAPNKTRLPRPRGKKKKISSMFVFFLRPLPLTPALCCIRALLSSRSVPRLRLSCLRPSNIMQSLLLAASCVVALAQTTLYPRPAQWPVPTAQQLAYGGSISALIHFNMATYVHDGVSDLISDLIP